VVWRPESTFDTSSVQMTPIEGHLVNKEANFKQEEKPGRERKRRKGLPQYMLAL
jgi:hypothetical protein